MDDSVVALANLIGKSKETISWRVDNLTASANLQKKIDLHNFVIDRPNWHYNSEQFPGSISYLYLNEVLLSQLCFHFQEHF